MNLAFQIPIILGERCRAFLEGELRRHSCPQQRSERIQIILSLAEGMSQARLSAQMGIHSDSIRTWRTRWIEQQDKLFAFESDPSDPEELVEAIEAVLSDLPRPGTPPTFKPEQVVAIIALACETPEFQTHWTLQALADMAVERGIVSSISRQSVWNFLKSR